MIKDGKIMLKLQEFLKAKGLDKLKSKLAIKTYEHPELPLVGFKYNQIDSPKAHPVVRECRGVVLEKDTWELIAKPFNRFFNVGEVHTEFKKFDWSNFNCIEKVDGSLIIVYYYCGEWHANTSGSFGLGEAPYYDGTWRDLFWKTAKINRFKHKLVSGETYTFELCTPYNKVVKAYDKPKVYLLGVTHNVSNAEYSEDYVDKIAKEIQTERPITYKASSETDVAGLLTMMEHAGELHEGVVIRDWTGLRYKWKTKKYLALHRLKDNGNVLLPSRLIDIVLTGETSEVTAVMPEVSTALKEVKAKVEKAIDEISRLWFTWGDMSSQKKFAMKVKDHKFSWVLFSMRKELDWEEDQNEYAEIRRIFLENSKKVAEKLFGKKVFTFDMQIVEST